MKDKIAVFGCSYSTEDKHNLPPTVEFPNWPTKLAHKLDVEVENYAKGGYDNQNIFRNVIRYINLGGNPKYILVQWTECQRKNVWLDKNVDRYDPTTVLKDHHSTSRPPMHSFCYDRAYIADTEFLPEAEDCLIYSYLIEEECKKHNIEVRFINYHKLNSSVITSPFYDMINKDLWLYEGILYGIRYHMEYLLQYGFYRHNIHDISSHFLEGVNDYLAEKWYDFLTNKKHIELSEHENSAFGHYEPASRGNDRIFDYT